MRDLDQLLKKGVIRVSISKIISELFYENRSFKTISQNGEMYHFRLGFTNTEKYCTYIPLDFMNYQEKYIEICGVPDRIYCNDTCFVDELKTTVSFREEFARKVGYAQLQLYMLVTGVKRGRLYIYLKDKNVLKENVYDFDKGFVFELIKRYLTLLSEKRNIDELYK